MILPTADDLAAAKAGVLAKFGRADLEQVELKAPIDFCLLLAPLGFRAWCQLVDEQARDPETPKRSCVVRQLAFPDAATTAARFERRPAAAGKAFGCLLKRAGQTPDAPSIELLDDAVRHASADKPGTIVIPGLTVVKAQELLAADPDAELWAVTGPHGLSFVMETPDADVFLAAKTAAARARDKGERITEAKLDFARAAIKWSATPLDALLEDKPALSVDIKAAFDLVAGEGADATSKSL